MDKKFTSGVHRGQPPLKIGHSALQDVFDLLSTRHYKQVEQLLQEQQEAAQQNGQMAMVIILAAACQLCQACLDCQEQEEHHQHLHETAVAREQDLRRNLQSILSLLNKAAGGQLAVVPAPEPDSEPAVPDEALAQPGFWQRTKELLGMAPSAAPPQITEAPRAIGPDEPVEPDIGDMTPATRSPHLETDDQESNKQAETTSQKGLASVVRATASDLQPSLVVYCLGPFRVYQNDQLVTSWSGLKGLSIFKYLIAHEGGPVSKEVLMDVFWPDTEFEVTRRNLHQAIYSLRQTLRHRVSSFQYVLFRNDRYELNPDIELWIDFVEFKHHAKVGKHYEVDGNLAAAMVEYGVVEGLYQGDFLSEDLYETWPLTQREGLRTIYLEATDRLSAYYQQREEHTAAIAICQKILAHDNCYETAHRRLMESYLAFGQRHLAIRQYETCFDALAKELELKPSEKTVEIYNSIKST